MYQAMSICDQREARKSVALSQLSEARMCDHREDIMQHECTMKILESTILQIEQKPRL